MRFVPDKLELVEGSVKTITLDLAPQIGASTISSIAFTADPSGITFASPTISGKTATALVSGGSGGSNYIAKLTAVLSNGETEVGTILLKWKEPGDITSGGV